MYHDSEQDESAGTASEMRSLNRALLQRPSSAVSAADPARLARVGSRGFTGQSAKVSSWGSWRHAASPRCGRPWPPLARRILADSGAEERSCAPSCRRGVAQVDRFSDSPDSPGSQRTAGYATASDHVPLGASVETWGSGNLANLANLAARFAHHEVKKNDDLGATPQQSPRP